MSDEICPCPWLFFSFTACARFCFFISPRCYFAGGTSATAAQCPPPAVITPRSLSLSGTCVASNLFFVSPWKRNPGVSSGQCTAKFQGMLPRPMASSGHGVEKNLECAMHCTTQAQKLRCAMPHSIAQVQGVSCRIAHCTAKVQGALPRRGSHARSSPRR